MKINWEGEIKHNNQNLYIHAQYALGRVDNCLHRVVLVDAIKAYDEANRPIKTDFSMFDVVAEIIECNS